MARTSRWLIVLSALSSLAACSGAPKRSSDAEAARIAGAESVVPFVGTVQVHRFSLPNGLRLLVVEDHSSPTFAYHTWFRVGSRDEVPGHTGLAHLFEHMMFKGTRELKEGAFDRMLESAGAEGENAFTSRDYTAYVQELPSTQLDLIARLEADRMVNLVVNDQSFKTETAVVQNERRFRNENNPDGSMYQELFEVAYTKHPYHWPVIGYQKDLDSMSGADAVQFYRSYYSPNHATVVIVGDVAPLDAFATVSKHYGALPSQASPVRTIDAEPAQIAPRRKQLELNMQVEKLMMGYHIPEMLHEDIPAIDVLQTVLSGGKSSRLYRALVETGLATGVDAFGLDDKDPALFVVSSTLQKNKRAAMAEAVILREIDHLVRGGISAPELERAKNRIEFGFYESLNSNSEKARFLGHYEAVAADFRVGIQHYERIKKVTAPEVQAVARRYLEKKNRSVITGIPMRGKK